MLEMIEGKARGNSGSMNYVDADVQAVNVYFGVPYEATNQFSLIVALQHSQVGIQVVQFANGSVCYGFVNHEGLIPSFQKIARVKKMAGVVAVHYFGKNSEMKAGK